LVTPPNHPYILKVVTIPTLARTVTDGNMNHS